MKHSIYLAAILCIAPWAGNAQSKTKTNSYQYTIDLTAVVDDKVKVELVVPPLSADEIVFSLPKIIPGTYAIEDYGRYVSDFNAVDRKGRKIDVEKISTNSWKIKSQKKLAKISYWIDDTFDTEKGDPKIFEPAGTNIEANNFLINNSGLFGYFDGAKNLPFVLNVIRDKEFYGSTGLIARQTGSAIPQLQKEKPVPTNKRLDVFETANYDQLVDSPIMYSKADTAIIKVANTEVLISSYSPNNKITAKEIASSIREVLMAQKEFLGGKLPVDKYAFIFYWTDKPVQSYGALEHSYSSVYYMPEQTIGQVRQQLRDFAAHEFFHIVTPLTIHSEEIHQFDFNDPKMSKHLWLYEGVTEYFAGIVQLKYHLIPMSEYLAKLQQKLTISDDFLNEVPFTDISLFTLEKYADQYYNVYQKGALIGLCLDVKLLQLSNGKYGMQSLMADLSKKYGKDKAFKDGELFDHITALTYPEIGEFLSRFVAGPEKLPVNEIFQSLGIIYKPEALQWEFSTGLETKALNVISHEGISRFQIKAPDALNSQGKAMNFLVDDIIIKINSETMPPLGPELQPFFDKQKQSMKEGEKLTFVVLRANEKNELKEVTLEAPINKVERKKKHTLEIDPNASPERVALRNGWLGIY